MDHYGQMHSVNSVTSSMNQLGVGTGNQDTSLMSSPKQFYPSMSNPSNEEFFQYSKSSSTVNSLPNFHSNNTPANSIVSSTYDPEVLNQLKDGMTRMISILERLEQRVNRVEQATSQILKNQQETFQVPFMSQKEIDTARSLAEQLEQDTSVAKQLQAAYNKEVDLKKRSGGQTTLAECPVCGTRVNQVDLESHVGKCLDLFSDDPKKEIEVKETKQKMETGFFGKFFNKTKTETTTTKVISRSNSSADPEAMSPGLYPPYGYPQFANAQFSNPQFANAQFVPQNMNTPMMMPMYMYPGGYPGHMAPQSD